MNFIIVQVVFCDKPINWKAMNSDRIEPKGHVKGPRIFFVCVQLKLHTKKSCKIIYINIVAILLLAAVLCYAQTAQSLSSRTTDTQRGNSLHCTAENSIPIPNF